MIRLGDIFDVRYGTNLALNAQEKTDDIDPEGINFVARGSQDNGVAAKIKPVPGIAPIAGGALSVAAGGSVLETFLHLDPFYSGRDLYFLTPKGELSERQLLYYCMCIRANNFRYNYGRQANRTLRDIPLPAPYEMPDWVHSTVLPDYEDYKKPVSSKRVKLPGVKDWKKFNLPDLFTITGSITTPLEELELYGEGKYPYVTTQAVNNGVAGHYNYFTEKGGVLTIDSAVLGYVSYQPENFSASDHVEKMIPRFPMNEYTALFLVTVLNREQFRYNYGRKSSQRRLDRTIISLPAIKGAPDLRLMEDYIKSLPFSSAI